MKTTSCHRRKTSVYADRNIPKTDFPGNTNTSRDIPSEFDSNVPGLSEDTRPRKDGPGGE